MFHETLLDSASGRDSALSAKRGWISFAAAYCFEAIVVGLLALAPLLKIDALPKLLTSIDVPAPPPPPAPPRVAPAVKRLRRTNLVDLLKVPIRIPKTIIQFRDEPAPPLQGPSIGVVGDVPGGVPEGSAYGVWNGVLTGLNSAPPPPPPKAMRVTRIQVGGQVEAAKLIFQPKPEYPPLARMARIQGTVRLEAVISREGTVDDLKALSGHPLLVNAALEGVSRWRYQPTLLNGEPVEVVTEIVVNFTLAE